MGKPKTNINPVVINLNDLEDLTGNAKDEEKSVSSPIAILAWTLLVSICFLPFFFGGRGELANSVIKLLFCISIIVAISLDFYRSQKYSDVSGFRISSKVFKLFTPFLLYLSMQIIPIPLGILEIISLNSSMSYLNVGASYGFISIDPLTSISAFSWIFLFAALYSLLLDVPYVSRSIKAKQSVKRGKSKTVFFSPVSRQYDEFSEVLQETLIYVSLFCAVIGISHLALSLSSLFGIYSFTDNYQHATRAHWPFVNANQLAFMLEIGLMLCFVRFLRERQLKMLSLTQREELGIIKSLERLFYSFEKQIFSISIMFILAIGLVLTMSRAGISLTFLGMTAVWVFYKFNPVVMISNTGFVSPAIDLKTSKTKKLKNLFKVLLVPLIVGVFIFSFIGDDAADNLTSRIDGTFNSEGKAPRLTFNKMTLEILKQNLIFGVGLNSWASAAPEFAFGDVVGWGLDYAHNDYFQLISEIGVVGLGLLLIPIVLGLKKIILLKNEVLAPVQKVHLFGLFISLSVPALHACVDFPYHLPLLAFSIMSILLILSRAVLFLNEGKSI